MGQIKAKISVIGVGRLGSALVTALHNNHFTIAAIVDHNFDLARNIAKIVGAKIYSSSIGDLAPADILFIAVPDDEIKAVVSELAIHFEQQRLSKFVFHTSGAMASDVFDPLQKFSVAGASFHPIQTFSGAKNDWQKFQNIYFGVEGNPAAVEKAAEIIDVLNGNMITIPPGKKSLYHLACTMASNYLISLMVPVVDLFDRLNLSESESLKIIYPLLQSTLSNLKTRSLAGALTGPLSRGDVKTIAKHLEVLSRDFPAYRSLYQVLGKILLNLPSVAERIPDERINTLRKMLNGKGPENK